MRFLSNKEKKDIISKLPKDYEASKKDEIKEANSIILKNNEKFLILKDNEFLPHLKSLPENSNYPSVFTDKGAIPFIAKGADLMKPGIREVKGEFEKGEIVIVRDENKEKAYAIGIAMLNSKEMKAQTSGKSLEIYHFIGDEHY